MALKYEVRVANMEGITMGYIHLGAFGFKWPCSGFFFLITPIFMVNGVIGEGIITQANLVGPFAGEPFEALVNALTEGNAYVNIHTAAFPPGEIRGQISGIKEDKRTFKTQLSGKEEVPPVDTEGCGTGVFKFDSKISSLTFQVDVEGLENVRFAHIHIGKKSENGPFVAFLRHDKVEGPVNGVYAKGTLCAEDLIGKMLGGDLLILREAMCTGNAYVNVHTDKHPPGEIRGQL